MNNNTIRIGKDTYPLGPAFLYPMPQPTDEGKSFLSIDLHAASDNKTTAGLAINCLSLLEHSSIEEIQGLHISFCKTEDDPRIELGESVIGPPGSLFDLEIAELSLDLGHIRDKRISVEMRGLCFSLVVPEVEFHACFDAQIK
jgi:hypothetical protein